MATETPKKCQLTVVTNDGTTVQVMVSETAETCAKFVKTGIETKKVIELNCIAQDDRIDSDVMYLIPGQIAFFSIIQPKPESLIQVVAPHVVDQLVKP